MKASGLDGFIAEPAPLYEAAKEAIDAWNFCGGYYPERLPLFCELHGMQDAEMIINLLCVIRDQNGQQ